MEVVYDESFGEVSVEERDVFEVADAAHETVVAVEPVADQILGLRERVRCIIGRG